MYCWGLDFSAFDEKGVFSRISLILTVFYEFDLFFVILCGAHKFELTSDKFVTSAQKLRKIGQIREKTVKVKEIREKTPFLSNAEKSSPHQYNKVDSMSESLQNSI